MKTPRKNTKKTASKSNLASGETRKTKLKPISSKSKKNWKNRILEEEEDFDITFDEDDLDPFDDLGDLDDDDYDRY